MDWVVVLPTVRRLASGHRTLHISEMVVSPHIKEFWGGRTANIEVPLAVTEKARGNPLFRFG
jgi:hypothetical protein